MGYGVINMKISNRLVEDLKSRNIPLPNLLGDLNEADVFDYLDFGGRDRFFIVSNDEKYVLSLGKRRTDGKPSYDFSTLGSNALEFNDEAKAREIIEKAKVAFGKTNKGAMMDNVVIVKVSTVVNKIKV